MTIIGLFLSVQTPYQSPNFLLKQKKSSKKIIVPPALCSPPSSTSNSTSSLISPSPDESIGCKACGKEEIEKGCNGEGRVQGGIATVPGFGWWPIKAYRPCPGFLASGGRYSRQGQSMDEVVSGSGRPKTTQTTTRSNSSKKKEGPKKLKE